MAESCPDLDAFYGKSFEGMLAEQRARADAEELLRGGHYTAERLAALMEGAILRPDLPEVQQPNL